jgi:hypothetical protein
MKMKKINYLCLALALCLGSCSKYNDQDALKQLIKAEALKPKLTADFVMQHFPCTEKIDTIVQTHTDYKYIDVVCPPADSTADTIYLDKIKVVTKNNVIKRTIALPSKTITITKYFEDSAKIKSLSLANSQTQAELKKCGEKKDKSSSLNLWLIICLCCSIIINLIQLRK